MPLSALHAIKPTDIYWQGWKHHLLNIPTLSNTEGSVAAWLNSIKPVTFTKTFVPQSTLPSGMAYEAFIFEQHKIPTRDGLHDFFNALCWLTFPKTKSAFNHIHQQQIALLGTTHRGKVRDMLTVIDENGFLIQCPDALWDALATKQWIKAFVELRPLWKQSRMMVFGHALLEKLVNPYKAITAHAIRLPSTLQKSDAKHFSSSELKQIDDYLSQYLTDAVLAQKPYIPIQIFGIPHWSAEEQNLAFYQDTNVFRMPKSRYTQ